MTYRLEPVFDLLAAGAMVFGIGAFMKLVADFMVGGGAMLLNRVNPSPKQRLEM